ncbi:DUF4364 family protein [Acutalibacter caecimuris]|uniref:DUF4364 family protein n=1 Tax=Acutalibacter caecimuris TaxID=3093657 RepID=UPI002AC95A89|nr:DUF4364 family protein [Acutalibacter sp. M00118]
MERDAFTGGVDPGGLWSKNDIRVLVCYILASVNAPLSEEDICQVVQGRALANYFETADALAALAVSGHITGGPAGWSIAATGREIAADLDTGLPLAVRDKALEAALSLLAMARARRENQVDIAPAEKGVRVTCRVLDGQGLELMALSLFVPDMAQAQLVRENFYKNPNQLYKLTLSSLTGDMSFAQGLFSP